MVEHGPTWPDLAGSTMRSRP